MRTADSKRLFTPVNLLLAALGVCLIISFSVVLILNFRPIYYHDMTAMDLAERYQMPEEEIRANYDALIDYNSLFFRGELHFPTLPMSGEGRIHFEEVKRIFDGLQILLILSAVCFFPLAFYQLRRHKNRGFLLLMPVITAVIAGLTGILSVVNWEWFFTAFHHVLFRNDYWLFDPDTDPIINLLPDEFFFHCLMGILAMVAGLLLLSLAGYFLPRHFHMERAPKKNS